MAILFRLANAYILLHLVFNFLLVLYSLKELHFYRNWPEDRSRCLAVLRYAFIGFPFLFSKYLFKSNPAASRLFFAVCAGACWLAIEFSAGLYFYLGLYAVISNLIAFVFFHRGTALL